MKLLDALCKAPSAGRDLDWIDAHCKSYLVAWDFALEKVLMIVAGALVAGIVVCIRRLQRGDSVGVVIGNTIEGTLYGALSVWAGSAAGVMLALLFNPAVLGVMLLVFALLALLVMIGALIKGSAGGVKAVGVICLLSLAASLVIAAVFAFRIPGRGPAGDAYNAYLWAMSATFAATGFVGALVVALLRGYHWAVGWLLVPVNAAWGLLGNLLGLMNHFASLFFFEHYGKAEHTRRFYVRYDKGFNLKDDFDFTEGDAMSANHVEKHEAVHVLQHFVFGPIYPLSHAAWMALMFLPGIIAGAAKRSVGAGITDFTYYNNPWEVIAYAFAGTRNDGTTTLIFNDIVAWIIAVLWIACATVATILFFVARA